MASGSTSGVTQKIENKSGNKKAKRDGPHSDTKVHAPHTVESLKVLHTALKQVVAQQTKIDSAMEKAHATVFKAMCQTARLISPLVGQFSAELIAQELKDSHGVAVLGAAVVSRVGTLGTYKVNPANIRKLVNDYGVLFEQSVNVANDGTPFGVADVERLAAHLAPVLEASDVSVAPGGVFDKLTEAVRDGRITVNAFKAKVRDMERHAKIAETGTRRSFDPKTGRYNDAPVSPSATAKSAAKVKYLQEDLITRLSESGEARAEREAREEATKQVKGIETAIKKVANETFNGFDLSQLEPSLLDKLINLGGKARAAKETRKARMKGSAQPVSVEAVAA